MQDGLGGPGSVFGWCYHVIKMASAGRKCPTGHSVNEMDQFCVILYHLVRDASLGCEDCNFDTIDYEERGDIYSSS